MHSQQTLTTIYVTPAATRFLLLLTALSVLLRLQTLATCTSLDSVPPAAACVLHHDRGPCNGKHTRWYYNSQTEKCAPFLWGGCGGKVPFNSWQECDQAKCNQRAQCASVPDVGPCRAAVDRWYYNPEKKACDMFVWGGCRGYVPFKTLQQCQQADCTSFIPSKCYQTPNSKLCDGDLKIKWFYNFTSKSCGRKLLPDCNKSAPFSSLKECQVARCYRIHQD